MRHFEILGDGWTLTENDHGHILLRGPRSYGRRPDALIWKLLQHDYICPHCTHAWQPRNPARPPLSCPQCKIYLGPKREPIPEPGAGTVWEQVKEYI